jgi:hypothetical protein
VSADEERRLALGKVAYEEFASQRVALGNAMPPWQGGPSVTGGQGAELPDSEKEIWARVAEAVAAVIPFVITDEVAQAFTAAPIPHGWKGHELTRSGLRAAATAAGFRVEER